MAGLVVGEGAMNRMNELKHSETRGKKLYQFESLYGFRTDVISPHTPEDNRREN